VAGTAYEYWVVAYDGAGNTAASNHVNATTPPDVSSGGGSYVWAKSFGSSANDIGKSVAVDSDGNVVITGWFYGTVDFGGGPLTSVTYPWLNPINYQDIFLAKYSPSSGGYIWAKRFGDVGNDGGYSVAVDGNGDVIVVGSYQNSVDFGNGIKCPVYGQSDIFIAKYSGVDGSYLWAKQFGDLYGDYAYGVAVDKNDNVYVTGQYQGTINFGGVSLSSTSGNLSTFVVKLSSSGAHLWSKSFNSSVYSYGRAISVDGSGNVALTGSFVGTMNFGGGSVTSPGTSLATFIVKLSTSGTYIWSRSFGNATYGTLGMSVVCDNSTSGDVIVTGQFQGSVNFGSGLLLSSTTTAPDIFLVKYSGSNGANLWSKTFDGVHSGTGFGITADANNAVFLTGSFNGTIDFGGGLLLSIADDVFVAKFSSSGAHIWSDNFDYGLGQYGSAVATNGNGNISLTGYFYAGLDFGGGTLTNNGCLDIFVATLIP